MGPNPVRRPRSALVLAVGLSCLLSVSACTGSSSNGPKGSGTASTPSAPSDSSPDTTPSGPGPSSSPGRTSPGQRSRTPKPTSDPAPLTTVPTQPVRTLHPVPLRSSAAFGTGVSARVTAITHGVDRDQGPGAATGKPTVEFHLQLTNASARTVPVSAVAVSAAYGSSSTPAIAATTSTTAFSGQIAAGHSARAVYAFVVPTSSQRRVELTVAYRAGSPTVLLTGSAR